MTIFIMLVILFAVCLIGSDLLSERDVVRSRLSKAESDIQDLTRAEKCRKLTHQQENT